MIPRFIRLEERILFDAAAVVAVGDGGAGDGGGDGAAEGEHHTDQGDTAENQAVLTHDDAENRNPEGEEASTDGNSEGLALDSPEASDQVHVLVVASNVTDFQSLADAAGKNVLVVIYDPSESSLASLYSDIQTALDGQMADSIALATHGNDGYFTLTTEVKVSESTLLQNPELQQFWEAMGGLIKEGGRLDLLACNVAEGGDALLAQLDALLDVNGSVDIAASTDMTGNHSGENWVLEVGNVDAMLYFDASVESWSGSLVLPNIFTVTNIDQSGEGSLRWAIEQANATPNNGAEADVIQFNIPESTNQEVHIIPTDLDGVTSVLPLITESVVIDGFSQAEFVFDNAATDKLDAHLIMISGVIEGDAGVGDFQSPIYGLYFAAGSSGSSVSGVIINNMTSGTADIPDSAATELPTLPDGFSTGVSSGSYSAAIFIDSGVNDVTVQSNWIGTDQTGNAEASNQSMQYGILALEGSGHQIGGSHELGEGNVIGFSRVAHIGLFNETNVVVQGNNLGVGVNGSTDIGGGSDGAMSGLLLWNTDSSQIGGDPSVGSGLDNVIGFTNGLSNSSSSLLAGIAIMNGSDNNVIEGNAIGETRSGGDAGNGYWGIQIQDSNQNTIGSLSSFLGNKISYNGGLASGGSSGGGIGVSITDTGVFISENNQILGNTFTDNEGLAIDLGINGSTANDMGDPDIGPNLLMNFPDLYIAEIRDSLVVVNGYLDFDPTGLTDSNSDGIIDSTSEMPLIQFYTVEPILSGVTIIGESLSFLGTQTVSHLDGLFTFQVALSDLGGLTQLTATATDLNGNTSEFGNSVFLQTATHTHVVENTSARIDQVGSLAWNVLRANQLANDTGAFGADTLIFNIPTNELVKFSEVIYTIEGESGGTPITQDLSLPVYAYLIPTQEVPVITEALQIDASGTPGVILDGSLDTDAALTFEHVSNSAVGNYSTISNLGIVQSSTGIHLLNTDLTVVSNTFIGWVDAPFFYDGPISASLAEWTTLITDGYSNLGLSTPTAAELIALLNSITDEAQAAFADFGGNGIGILLENADNSTIGDISTGGGDVFGRNIITNNTTGIELQNSNNNTIQGNFIGLDLTGSQIIGNLGDGIIDQGGNANLIGGSIDDSLGNVIAGNQNGVVIQDATNAKVQGNLIGTDYTGSGPSTGEPVQSVGVQITGGSGHIIGPDPSVVGFSAADAVLLRNVISEHSQYGIHASETTNVAYYSNFIGTNTSGNGALPNNVGMLLEGVTFNQIGGDSSLFLGNLISGNTNEGLLVKSTAGGTTSADNQIQGNIIGMTVNGLTPLSNLVGIKLSGTENNLVGGSRDANLGNLISGNQTIGLHLDQALGELVQGNVIGPDINGALIGDAATPPPQNVGIRITGGSDHIIGPDPSATGFSAANAIALRNYISGNLQQGIYASETTRISYYGNYIGTDFTGNSSVPNGVGMLLESVTFNQVGGESTLNLGNLISGNTNEGLLLQSTAAGGTSADNQIQGNIIGMTADGLTTLSNLVGVKLSNTANNLIGGSVIEGLGNLITGNQTVGIHLDQGMSDLVQGNKIGIKINGSAIDIGDTQQEVGIKITEGSGHIIGPDPSDPGFDFVSVNTLRNIISGNSIAGIDASLAEGISIYSNFLGTNLLGSAAIANGIGIHFDGVTLSQIGGDSRLGLGNLISGNTNQGIFMEGVNGLTGVPSTDNKIQGNIIGLDISGASALSNSLGIRMDLTADNLIGGSSAEGLGNLISGNQQSGIQLNQTNRETIQGNFIGTNAAGDVALPNGSLASSFDSGILIADSLNTVIGGSRDQSLGNLISGNPTGIYGIEALGLTVQGNLIGTNLNGEAMDAAGALQKVGIKLSGGSDHLIGPDPTVNGFGVGDVAALRNLISGNTQEGIYALGTTNAVYYGNYIGTNLAGDSAVSNSIGIHLDGVTFNQIGGDSRLGLGNLISGNTNQGIFMEGVNGLTGVPSTDNKIQGNIIGLDVSGTSVLSNSLGIRMDLTADNLIGGSSAEGLGNLISGNQQSGIQLNQTNRETIQGNFIGTNAAGDAALPNGSMASSFDSGILIADSLNTVIGGSSADHLGNLISGNYRGIYADSANGLTVQGNQIGTNASGDQQLGEQDQGIILKDSRGEVLVGGDRALSQSNLISGNRIGISIVASIPASEQANIQIMGNLIGTDLAGTMAIPLVDAASGSGVDPFLPEIGISIEGASNVRVGQNLGSGFTNVISGHSLAGILVTGDNSNNKIEGNYIGTDLAGLIGVPNETGIVLDGSSGTAIGGLASGSGNLISGNGIGIDVESSSHSNTIQSNFIGLSSSNGALGNSQGIAVQGYDNLIGGENGSGNVIAFNTNEGIFVGAIESINVQNSILSNSIHDNGKLGIDLGSSDQGVFGPDGVTLNDPGDADTGPNDLQNFPVITSVQLINGTQLVIEGTLDSVSQTTFLIQFFANDTVDSSGYGEGKYFLGSTTVTTNSVVNFNVSLNTSVPSSAQFLTATATSLTSEATGAGSLRNTSEFSAAASIARIGTPPPVLPPVDIERPRLAEPTIERLIFSQRAFSYEPSFGFGLGEGILNTDGRNQLSSLGDRIGLGHLVEMGDSASFLVSKGMLITMARPIDRAVAALDEAAREDFWLDQQSQIDGIIEDLSGSPETTGDEDAA